MPPGVSLFAQRVLVAFDTSEGVVYAAASGWDRVYLLWTFRNFRSLPQTVLNPRQQRLLGALYRDRSHHPVPESDEAVVIGTVEDFSLSSLVTLPGSIEAGELFPATSGEESVDGPALDVPALDVPALDQQPYYARFAFHRMPLKVGAGALVAIIAVLAWHQLGAQPVSGSESTQKAAAATLSDERRVTATDLNPALVEPPSNLVATLPSPIPIVASEPVTLPLAGKMAAAEVTAKPLARTASGNPEARALTADAGAAESHSPVALSPSAYETSVDQAAVDQPRMRISGRPQKLVYPVCPQTPARGKVSLQAVVGYDGAVNQVSVLTGDRVLAAAAVEAVRQWRYQPFSGAAQSLERETNITVSFISNQVVAVSFPNSAPLSR
jgi:protein TonB